MSGAKFDRKIIVKLPSDCGGLLGEPDRGHVQRRLLKSAYGLSDAPLLWWEEANRRLISLKWRRHPLDRCLYCYYNGKRNLLGALILHVDDLLIAGDNNETEFLNGVVELRKGLDFGKWQSLDKEPIVYCGGKLEKNGDGLTLSFGDYVRKIAPLNVPKEEKSRDLNTREISKVRGMLGALQWPATQGVFFCQPPSQFLPRM